MRVKSRCAPPIRTFPWSSPSDTARCKRSEAVLQYSFDEPLALPTLLQVQEVARAIEHVHIDARCEVVVDVVQEIVELRVELNLLPFPLWHLNRARDGAVQSVGTRLDVCVASYIPRTWRDDPVNVAGGRGKARVVVVDGPRSSADEDPVDSHRSHWCAGTAEERAAVDGIAIAVGVNACKRNSRRLA